MSEQKPDSDHWLVRPKTIRLIWIWSIIILVLLVLGDFLFHHHSYFGLDGTFGFGAWYGFISCIVLVVGSKLVGLILKRPDTYYDE